LCRTASWRSGIDRLTVTCDEFALSIEVYCKVQVTNGKRLVVISVHAS
jgi:hypothetical protein